MTDSLASDFARLAEHYDALGRQHGDSPAAVQQSSVETQDRRLAILAEIGPMADASVLDFGCGTGRLLDVLRASVGFHGRYTGYDVSEELLRIARGKHPDAAFERRDIFAEGVGGEFDYALVSGVFNNRISDNRRFIAAALTALFAGVRKGLAFNALSTYVDYHDEGLYYADPGELFRWCKEQLSPAVTLRHDYEIKPGVVPFEFTIYVHRSAHAPRAKLGDR